MTIVVAYTDQDSGRSALDLAAMMARSTTEPLVVTVVVATPYSGGGVDFVDGDYLGPLTAWGESVLETARTAVPAGIEASFEVRRASSIPKGLMGAAADHDASTLVLGSSTKGSLGRITLGSITDRLVHAAPLPVLLAPRGFRTVGNGSIRRVSIGYGGSPGGAHLAAVGARLADSIGAALRAVSFSVRPPKRFFGSVEQSADDLVVNEWVARTRAALAREVGPLDPALSERLLGSLVVGEGISWGKAIWDVPWHEGDLLVVGPSSSAPAARLFLGSRASKIVRSSPVPVLMVPGPRVG